MATITTSQVAGVIHQFGRQIMREQEGMAAPSIGPVIEKKKVEGKVTVRLGDRGLESVSFVADGGTLPTRSHSRYKEAYFNGALITGILGLGHVALRTANGKQDAVNLLREEMVNAYGTMIARVGRRVVKATVGKPVTDGTTVNVTTTAAGAIQQSGVDGFMVADPNGYQPNMRVEIRVSNTLTYVLKVTEIKHDADTGEARIIGTLYDGTVADGVESTTVVASLAATDMTGATYAFYPRGSYGDGMYSIEDVHADAALYGESQNEYGWSGNLKDAGGAVLTLKDLRRMSAVIKRRTRTAKTIKPWSHLIMSSVRADDFFDLHQTNLRFNVGVSDTKSADLGMKHKPTFEGRPVFEDDNFPDDWVYLHNKEDIALAVWDEIEPVYQGDKKDINSLLVSQTNAEYQVQHMGIMQLWAKRRSTSGLITNLAAT